MALYTLCFLFVLFVRAYILVAFATMQVDFGFSLDLLTHVV